MKPISGKKQSSKDGAEATASRLIDLRQPEPSTTEGLDQARPTNDQTSPLALQSSFGNAAVARTMIQRKADSEEVSGLQSAASETANSSSETPAGAAAATTPAQALIVEDNVETLAPGQMKKGDFLAQLRSAVSSTAADALAGSPFSAAATPYIDSVFAQYGAQSSAQLEGSIRRYAPEAVAVASAGGFIPIVTGRVRRSLKTFVATGQLTGVPEGLPMGLPDTGSLGAIGGAVSSAASGVAGVASSVASAVDSAVSAVGGLLFKEHEGGAREVNDPQAIQNQLGAGQSLDPEVRSRMESAFGEGFGGVQIHADPKAAGISENLNARALTVGPHIAFGTGEYRPGTLIGDALIAHELAHVIQQRSGAATVGPAHKGGGDTSQLEAAADHAAVSAVVSSWGGARRGLAKIANSTLANLKSGLRLQRCDKTSSGPVGPKRLADAQTNFQNKNSQLTTDELGRIEAAIAAVSSDNINFQISFYDYYSGHKITKMGAEEAASALKNGLYANTSPDSGTIMRPDLLDPGFAANQLGSLLIHEFTHTRHSSNPMGLGDFQEGDSYGIEYFLALRSGATARAREIMGIVTKPTTVVIPSLVEAFKIRFKSSFATMDGLYEIIDGRPSTHGGSPFLTPAPLTRDEAKALAAELVSTREDNRSERLKRIMEWVGHNLSSFPSVPPI